MTEEISWIEDGHTVSFSLKFDEVELTVICPFEGGTGTCNQGRDYCVVRQFIGIYGTELNQGACEIDGPVRIAWLPERGDSDLDPVIGQVWWVPVSDDAYEAWKTGTETPELE